MPVYVVVAVVLIAMLVLNPRVQSNESRSMRCDASKTTA
jgi:hypothetical protein